MIPEHEAFIRYCLDFYGRGGFVDLGMTRSELKKGLRNRLINHPEIPFHADDGDRQIVRDEVLIKRGKKPLGFDTEIYRYDVEVQS